MIIPLTEQNVGKSTLDDWVGIFWNIHQGQTKGRSLTETWAMVSECGGGVGEAVREGDPKKLILSLAHGFCWCCIFVARCLKDKKEDSRFRLRALSPHGKSFSRMVWYKFPDLCLHCQGPACVCPGKWPSKDDWATVRDENRLKGPSYETLNGWRDHFAKIYWDRHRVKYLTELAFHYDEEVDEVFKAIRKLRNAGENQIQESQLNLIEEIADVVSWTFSLTRKVVNDVERVERSRLGKPHVAKVRTLSGRFYLDRLLWDIYKNKDGAGFVCGCCWRRKCTPPDCDASLEALWRKHGVIPSTDAVHS